MKVWRIFFSLATLAISLFLAGCGSFAHDTPRKFPWQVPDFKEASYTHRTLPDGRIHLQITHLPLDGITPEMLAWWYQVLPVSTVQIGDTTYPFYHLFHLSEHGRVWVVEPATDGTPGMGVGALVARQEWFGQYDSQGKGRITEFSPQGMTAHPEAAGLWLGEIRHIFESVPGGSRYRIESHIGVEWPLIGPVVNWLLRTTTFKEPMLKEWERHQIEEVAMLRYFLPTLYAQRETGTYRLELFAKPIAFASLGTR